MRDIELDETININANVNETVVKAKISRECYFQFFWISKGEFKDWITGDNDSKYTVSSFISMKIKTKIKTLMRMKFL